MSTSFAVIVLSASAFGAVIKVPGDSATIQAGIDGASDGDTVLVANGIYTGIGNRDIDFNGKNIVVKSENGPEVTIIDCQDSARAFIIQNGEDSTAVIDGLTIWNGFDWMRGGAIYIADASPTVRNCIFQNNSAYRDIPYAGSGRGGAIYCLSGSPNIEGCDFIDNIAWYGTYMDISRGGGVYFEGASLALTNCTFDGNFAVSGCGLHGRFSSLTLENCLFKENAIDIFMINGGGVSLHGCDATLNNCSFIRNRSVSGGAVNLAGCTVTFSSCLFAGNRGWFMGGAIALESSSSGVIENCTFSGNIPPGLAGGLDVPGTCSATVTNSILAFGSQGQTRYRADMDCDVTLTCCNIFGNEGGDWKGCIANQADSNGNFTADPLFCDTTGGDYSLFVTSSCAPANNNCGVLIGALDVGCSGPTAMIVPDTMYALEAYTIDSLLAVIYFGDFVDGHTASDIDPATVQVKGTISPASWTLLPSHPGFVGEVMEITFSVRDFILSYGLLWDTTTQEYAVTGQFSDSATFLVTDEVAIIGHTAGDVNANGVVNIADLTYFVDFLFNGGPEPPVMGTADLDNSGMVNVADLTFLVAYLFQGGPPPAPCP